MFNRIEFFMSKLVEFELIENWTRQIGMAFPWSPVCPFTCRTCGLSHLFGFYATVPRIWNWSGDHESIVCLGTQRLFLSCLHVIWFSCASRNLCSNLWSSQWFKYDENSRIWEKGPFLALFLGQKLEFYLALFFILQISIYIMRSEA